MERERKGLIKDPVILKGLTMFLLVGLLLIPLALISEVVSERSHRKTVTEDEIISNFGGELIINNPMIVVPYSFIEGTGSFKKEVKTKAYFLPNTINISGEIIPEVRNRGIYEFLLYTSHIEVSGTFDRLDFSGISVDIEEIFWDEAYLEIEVSDLKGLRQKPQLNLNEEQLILENETSRSGFYAGGLKSSIDSKQDGYTFSGNLSVQGGRSIRFIPTATETHIDLKSSWQSPSFFGSYLPKEHNITEGEGFTANWYILAFTNNFSTVMSECDIQNTYIFDTLLGVNLKVPVDIYLMTERSLKYGILFLILPFIVFFLFEIFSKIKVHPFHYMFVGITASLFFLLLIAISEHYSFKVGYITGVLAVSSLITYYACHFLKSIKRGVVILPIMFISYTFMYVMINSEDYALLMGTLGLFSIVAGIMITTRKVDWYKVEEKSALPLNK